MVQMSVLFTAYPGGWAQIDTPHEATGAVTAMEAAAMAYAAGAAASGYGIGEPSQAVVLQRVYAQGHLLERRVTVTRTAADPRTPAGWA